MRPSYGTGLALGARALGVAAFTLSPLAHAGHGVTAYGGVMVPICSQGVTLYVPLLPVGSGQETPTPPTDGQQNPTSCHAPCPCGRQRGDAGQKS